MGGLDDLVDRGNPAGDVGGTAKREQPQAASRLEHGPDGVHIENSAPRRTRRSGSGRHGSRAGRWRGVDDGGDDHVVAGEPESVGEVVDRLSGVAADDGNVISARPPRERAKALRACSCAEVAS